MTGFVLRVLSLLAVYLLVLTSVAPGDILIGSLLAIALVASTRRGGRRPDAGWLRWAAALMATLLATGQEIVLGTVRTVRFALGEHARPGFVEIPREGRSRRAVALWGVLTGEAPDEFPVDVDPGRDVLIVHVLDARDPAAIRARHAAARERWQRHVVE
jgi:multisubunit Na+/H+ antiporter MnhE subunit